MTTDFHRIRRLPPYVFEEVNRIKARLRGQGVDIIDFGMGNPDMPTPKHIVDKMIETARDPKSGRYSASKGIIGLRRAMAGYYDRRYGVKLNPDTEVIATLGSKEGFANLANALTAPGDVIICPNPAYPIHAFGFIMAGGVIRHVPALSPEEYLSGVSRAVKNSVPPPTVLILSYPSNPTAQWVDLDFYKDAVALAKKHEDARAEQEKMLSQRIEVLEERRRETTREQAEAEAARREAEAANTAKATAESRLAEREQQLTAFEAERRAWRADLEASGQRVRALEAAVEKHEQLKKAFERDIADMKVNAERRAREKLAVREMSDEARATAAARPSVELLKENERLRRELNEMHREGARRTNEAVAAMASLAARQVGRGLNPSDHEAASPARAASPRRGGGGNAPLFKDLD
jgi:hypothetical protein